jgi:hypothetical protein
MALSESDELYGRYYKLTIESDREKRDWSELPLQFNIKKTSDRAANPAEITILNLAESSRNFISKKGLKITLDAGYEQNHGIIYQGNTEVITHEHGTVDWQSKIEATDGAFAKRNAFMSETFDKGTPIETVIKKIAAKMTEEMDVQGGLGLLNALQLGVIDAVPTKLPPRAPIQNQTTRRALTEAEKKALAQQKLAETEQRKIANVEAREKAKLEKAATLHNFAVAELDFWCRSYGLKWVITDGKINVYPEARGLTSKVIKLTKYSGLIGKPEATENGFKFRSLLRADINPGQLVKVESNIVTGVFEVIQLEHIGNNKSQEWYSEFEGVAKAA